MSARLSNMSSIHAYAGFEQGILMIEQLTQRQLQAASMMTQIQRAMAEQSARDLVAANDRQSLRCHLENRIGAMQTATEQAARDLASANDRQASLENRMESIQRLTTQVLSLERRMASVETLATTRSETLKTAIETVSWDHAAKLSQMAGDLQRMQSTTEEAARDLALAKDRQASLEARVESIENYTDDFITDNQAKRNTDLASASDRMAQLESRMSSIEQFQPASFRQLQIAKEQITGELCELQYASQMAVRDRMSAQDRQANLENRFNSMAAELQQLQTARERAARDLASAMGRQATLENHLERIEKLIMEQLAGSEQISKSCASAASRHVSLASRLESIEKFEKDLKEQIATEEQRQANLESRLESIEKLTNVKMAGELQTTAEQAARELASANDRQASLENRTVEDLPALQFVTEFAMIAWELQQLVTATEQAARDRQASREMDSIENLTEQQIAAELEESHTAREQAANDLILANGRHASLENHPDNNEYVLVDEFFDF